MSWIVRKNSCSFEKTQTHKEVYVAQHIIMVLQLEHHLLLQNEQTKITDPLPFYFGKGFVVSTISTAFTSTRSGSSCQDTRSV